MMVIVTAKKSLNTAAADDVAQASEASTNPTERITAKEDGTRRKSETQAGVTQSNVDAAIANTSDYCTIGFESPLRGQCLQFAQPLPNIRVCCGCRFLPDKSFMLPCSHTLCVSCCEIYFIDTRRLTGYDDASGEDSTPIVWCPEDGVPRAASDLQFVALNLEQVRGEIAFCVNSVSGCPFKAELRHVEQHYPTCAFGNPICESCRRSDIPASGILFHTFLCMPTAVACYSARLYRILILWPTRAPISITCTLKIGLQ
ncbi:hypothetical protein HPB52_011420 [Rhipicephalus sanguineus]|uniref:Uncharacterized protein n=1 Tax=Rhipicephalus sanguineus TaxID=34632 RepID=A0A9D4T643_RHISA|nr:hypothetical protein HPB52_011420 [Rhipicephalus sanguineus]